MDISIQDIDVSEVLPYSYPFLMVDKVLEIEFGKFAKTCKCITRNEPWTTGHFSKKAIFPGVLMIENMAQTAALIYYNESGKKFNELYLANVENIKFLTPVFPGVRLETVAHLVFSYDNLAKIECEITLEDNKVAQGTLILYIK